ncbi:MAG: sulfatase, partial [Moorella sp. (in: Bacteria)]|nr:sulfatase [Moorella sp. (in: firmicutes)]
MDARAKKFLLITIDTLRADHLGCYGYRKNTSPHLDALARQGILFRHAYSPCTYTVPAHASIMTGKYVPHHSIGYYQGSRALDVNRDITLAEVMRSKGLATAAFVSALVLHREWRLDSGFEVYNDTMTGSEQNRPFALIRDGLQTNAAALAWIKKHGYEKFFVWIHYFDVHGPYLPPAPYNSCFAPEDYGEEPVLLEVVDDGSAGGIPRYQLLRDDQTGEVIRDARHYLAGYDGGVRYVDHVVGELFRELQEVNLFPEMLVIITSDPGEALGENNVYFFHGLTLTPEQIHVPLLVKLPAGENPAGQNASVPVSTVDIMPTLLEMVDFDYRHLSLDGLPLWWALQRPEL